MRHGPSIKSRKSVPWRARLEIRLALFIVAMLLVATAASAVTQRRNLEPTESGVTVAPENLVSPKPLTSVEPTPSVTPTPLPHPTPFPLLLDLRPSTIGVGETLLVWTHAPGAFGVSLYFGDEFYSLLPDGDVFWGVIGIPVDTNPSSGALIVTARSSSGELLETATASYELSPVERPVDYLELTPEQTSILSEDAAIREMRIRAEIFSEFDRGRRWETYFRRPTKGIISTEFGQGRSYNGGPVGSFHTGTDFATKAGTPVVAAAPGRIDWVGTMPIRGLSIVIDHGAGVKTGYHHLDSTTVTEGEKVLSGERIGEVGDSGLATGPHLHWELSVWGINVNPITWTLTDFTP